jgi:hypothetical protein
MKTDGRNDCSDLFDKKVDQKPKFLGKLPKKVSRNLLRDTAKLLNFAILCEMIKNYSKLVAMFSKLIGYISSGEKEKKKGTLSMEIPKVDISSWTAAFNKKLLFMSARKKLTYSLIAFLLITTPLGFLNDFFTILTLHGMAAISRFHYRFLKFSIGVELSVFMIALTGISHGPVVAAVVGAVHFIISVLITKEATRIVLPCLAGYVAVGIAAGLLPMTNILLFGMMLTLVYNLVTIPLFIHALKFSFASQLFFISTHFAFNYWVFSTFGQAGLKLIGL